MADTPDESSQDSTCQRAYDHNPEVGPGVAAEEGGAEGAGRVYGAVVDRNTHYVHQAEGKTDGHAGEIRVADFRGGAQDDEYEEEGEQDFSQQGHVPCGAGLKHVGGQRRGVVGAADRVGYAAELVALGADKARRYQPEEEQTADSGASELRDNVADQVLPLKFLSVIHTASETAGLTWQPEILPMA